MGLVLVLRCGSGASTLRWESATVRIGAVDFPELLLSAQRSGRLVIFAGAGVSVPPPSNYPDLNNLAKRIAEGAPVRREQREPIDRFLGRLKYQGVPVHRRAREALTRSSSRPTRLHYDLLSLFPSSSEVRLVTTNFDAHFTCAAKEIFPHGVEIFYAPALPLGHQIEGIVYLHGNVEKDPERIVLTDDDFGLAYLTEGWATRFLQSVFANYTVLFVGYSHNDPVMNYLSRGLPPEVRDLQRGRALGRFALTPEGGGTRWEFLDITPVGYPLVTARNHHAALGEAVSAWVRLSRMGSLDHRQRIRRLVAKGLPADRESDDYLAAALKDPETVRFFACCARGPEWLPWVEEHGGFRPLFQPEAAAEAAAELAEWFAGEFATRYPEEALALVRRQEKPMNPVLWEAVARQLLSSPGPDRERATADRWIALLLTSGPTSLQGELLSRLLERCGEAGADAAALLLFERLARPHLDLDGGPRGLARGEEGAVRGGVVLEVGEDRLRESWDRVFRPRLGSFAEGLEPILAAHLQQAHLLSLAAGEGEGRRVSVLRERGQPGGSREGSSRSDGAAGFLVEAAGELLRWMAEARPDRARVVAAVWGGSSVPALRALAEEMGQVQGQRAA